MAKNIAKKKIVKKSPQLIIERYTEYPKPPAQAHDEFLDPVRVTVEIVSGKNVAMIEVGRSEITGPHVSLSYKSSDKSDVGLNLEKFFSESDLRFVSPMKVVKMLPRQRWGVVLPRLSSLLGTKVDFDFRGWIDGQMVVVRRVLAVSI